MLHFKFVAGIRISQFAFVVHMGSTSDQMDIISYERSRFINLAQQFVTR